MSTPHLNLVQQRQFDRILRRFCVEKSLYSGMHILFSHQGHTLYNKAYGYRDIEHTSPITTDAIYRIYSMTKPIISLMRFSGY